MLYKEYLKVRNLETIKKLVKENEEIKKLINEAEEDFSEIFKIFHQLTKKLHSRRKVLNMPLKPKDDTSLVLHLFGFYVKYAYMHRSQPINEGQLIEFLRENSEETIDRIADEIPYKHKRTVFREYCKMVKKFLGEHDITDIKKNRKEIELSMICKKRVYDMEGKLHILKKIVLNERGGYYEDGVEITIIDNKSDKVVEFHISDLKENIESLIVFEQLEQEIVKGVKQFKQKLKKGTDKIGDGFLKELKEKFSTYLVAEQL